MTTTFLLPGSDAAGAFAPSDDNRPSWLRILSFLSEPTRTSLDSFEAAQSSLPTNAGATLGDPADIRPGASLAELRRLTGFTWEQLSELFDVSRRTLHFWASGKRQSADNEERLQRILDAIRIIDRGSSVDNRALLRETLADGTTPLALLRAGKYEDAIKGIRVAKNSRIARFSPDAATIAGRRPVSVEVLLSSVPAKPRPSSGRLLGSFPIEKNRRDK